jgi:uncharacterized membrane protein YagU involved in acid resistance
MQAELAGATAGLIATAPMTAAMELMYRVLPHEERYPLPPRQIVDNAIERVETQATSGIEIADDADRADLSLAAHFAFGAMAGSAYGAIARTRPSHPVLSGVGFGLLVWGSQYLGVLPAAGLLSNARHHPVRRNALMIAAHVVWGAALGALSHRLTDRRAPQSA